MIVFIKVLKFFSEDWLRFLLLMQGFGSGEYLQLLQHCVAPVLCHNLISHKEQAMIEDDSVGTIQFTVFSRFPEGRISQNHRTYQQECPTGRIVRTMGIRTAPQHMSSGVFERT